MSAARGIKAIQLKIVLMPKLSAILPAKGIKTPEVPWAKPITMLDTKDLPLGAIFWASATVGNRVANSRNPHKNEIGYTVHPEP